MIRFSIQIVGLALALMLHSAVVAAQGSGSIEGLVVAAGSSTPVPRATVTLETIGGREVAERISSIDGHFAIPDLVPGDYRIFASREGFVSPARGSQVTVGSGRNTSVSLSIIPEGVISGRVVDWDGFPVVGIQVQALTFISDDRGRRVLFAFTSDKTNDLGEYRIYWVHPGSYFVRADPADYGMPVRESLSRQAGQPTPEPQQLISTYFPSAVDAAGARRIDIRAGETFSGADIHLVELRKRRVSGVVAVARIRGAPDVQLTPRNPSSGISDYTASVGRAGSFEFENVVPGSYFLTANAIDADRVEIFGKIPIDVGNADVGNLSVDLIPGFDLRIRLTIEGRSRRSDDPQLVVNLRPAIPSTPFPTVERKGDDELAMHRFMPGDYSVAVLSLTNARSSNGSPANGSLYLKSAQYGGADVLTTGLHIEASPSGILDIAMADGAGSLSGSVLDDQKKPASGLTVVLIPEPRLRGRSDLYKTGMTDAGGKFEMSGIAPGQYKVFSWEDAAQGSWQYPDFLDPYEDRGQSVRIYGGKSDPITVQLIPPR